MEGRCKRRIRSSPQPRRVEGLGRGWKRREPGRKRYGAALGPSMRSSDTRSNEKTTQSALWLRRARLRRDFLRQALEKAESLPSSSLPCTFDRKRQSVDQPGCSPAPPSASPGQAQITVLEKLGVFETRSSRRKGRPPCLAFGYITNQSSLSPGLLPSSSRRSIQNNTGFQASFSLHAPLIPSSSLPNLLPPLVTPFTSSETSSRASSHALI